MSHASGTPEGAGPGGEGRTSGPAVCLGCGCLCDDIVVDVEGRDLVRLRNVCDLGRAWFAAVAAEDGGPEASVDRAAVSAVEAIRRAAELLGRARAPVVYGLTGTTTETVREALALADRLGARVVLGRSMGDLGRVEAFQNAGRAGATLGEVRNRADVVVFWGCDPSATHPRHGERYSIEPRGRFVPEGRAGRFVVVVDDRPNVTAEAADLVVPLAPDRDVDLIASLRLLVRRPDEPPDRLNRSTGLGAEALSTLAARLRGARYGVLFFQPRTVAPAGVRAAWEGLAGLVRDLNAVTRFVLMGLGGGGNVAGAEAAMTWQGGFLQGVDYGPGVPSPLDEAASLGEILGRGELDALLAVGDTIPDDLSGPARAHLALIPAVVVAPGAGGLALGRPTVGLASAATGVEVDGTVTRGDGVVLPVRALRGRRFPSDREWLQRLGERLGAGRP